MKKLPSTDFSRAGFRHLDTKQPESAFKKMDADRILPYARVTAKQMLSFLSKLTPAQRRFAVLTLPALLNTWVANPGKLGLSSKRLSLSSASGSVYANLDALAVALLHLRPIYVKTVPKKLWRAFMFSPEKDPKIGLGRHTKLSTSKRALTSWTDGIANANEFALEMDRYNAIYIFETTSAPLVLATPESTRRLIGDLAFCSFAFPDLRLSGTNRTRDLDEDVFISYLDDHGYYEGLDLHCYGSEREVLVYSTRDVACRVVGYMGPVTDPSAEVMVLPEYKKLIRAEPKNTPMYGHDKDDREMRDIDKRIRDDRIKAAKKWVRTRNNTETR